MRTKTDPASDQPGTDPVGGLESEVVIASPPPHRGERSTPTTTAVARRARRMAPSFGWAAFTLGIGFLVLWPLIQLQVRALEDGAAGYRTMADLPRIGQTLRTTLSLGLGSALFAMVAGTGLAWCCTRLPRRGRRVMSVVPLMPLVIPAVAAVIGWSFLLSPSVGYVNVLLRKLPLFSGATTGPIDVYSTPWIIIVTGLNLTSFVFLFVNTSLRNMGDEFEMAALTCGASRARAFMTITLPVLRPALAYSAGVVLLLGMGQFTAPLILGRQHGVDVLTTEMLRLTERFPINFGLGAALGSPIIVLGIIVVVLQRLTIGDHRRFVVVGARTQHRDAGERWWAVVIVALYGILAVGLPIFALVHVAVSPFWTGQFNFDNLTLDNVRTVLGNDAMVEGIKNSIRFSVIAIVVLLPLGFATAWALMGHGSSKRYHRFALDVFIQVPLAIPASLMGFALLFAYSGEPFRLYGTDAVMIVTYITLMIPHTTRLQLTTLMSLGVDFRDASRACGAGPLRTFVRVVIPLARKGVAATAAIVFVLLVHEFSASLMVRSLRTQVMGSLLYDTFNGGIYPQVAVVALIMVLVTTVGVILALAVAGRDSLENM